jgi:hypothetical protein
MQLRATRCNLFQPRVEGFARALGMRTSPGRAKRMVGKFDRSKPDGQKSRNRQSRSSAGLLRDFLVPYCAFLCSTIATAVQPTVFDQFTANRIRQLRFRHSVQFRSCPTGSPLQGECRRFDPVSTHQTLQATPPFAIDQSLKQLAECGGSVDSLSRPVSVVLSRDSSSASRFRTFGLRSMRGLSTRRIGF